MTTAVRTRKPIVLSPVVSPYPVRRFTLAEYHLLIDTGVLKPGDPYELLNGVLKYKMPQNTPHASTAGKLESRFWRLIAAPWFVRAQKPLTIPTTESEPEPDLAVVLGPADRYDDLHPYPQDVALVVEVSDTTLAEDRGEKRETYAAARIPVYWIVNIPERVVEVYTQPRGGKSPTYRTRTDYPPGTNIPVVLRGTTVGTIPATAVLPG